VASFYIWAIRGTPLLVQILFVYFALPVLVPGLNLPDFAAAVVALGLNVGAYNAEAIRAGLLAVPRGQTEAGAPWAWATAMCSWTWCSPGVQDRAAAAGEQLCGAAQGFVAGLCHRRGGADQCGQPHPVGHLPAHATLTTVAITYLILTTLVTQVTHAIEYRFDVEGRAK
jgi:polar amino acid transport system permease protein